MPAGRAALGALANEKGALNILKTRISLLPEDGGWYKANLHCHTTQSDGKWTPEEAKAAYQAQGYDILALTDHNVWGWEPHLNEEGVFVVLAGMEVNIDRPMEHGRVWDTTPVYHLNLYDIDPLRRRSEATPPDMHDYSLAAVNAYIAQMKQKNFLCCYNHPWWSLQTYADYAGLVGLDAFEIYNYGCELEGLYGYAPRAYDDLLRSGQRLACFAGDDNHNAAAPGEPFCDSFGGWTMVNAKKLGYLAVTEAMKQQRCYASNGPALNALYVEDGALHVACSPAACIYVHGAGRKALRAAARAGETLEKAAFPLTGGETYLRVEVRDRQGRFAASRAYFADELFPT